MHKNVWNRRLWCGPWGTCSVCKCAVLTEVIQGREIPDGLGYLWVSFESPTLSRNKWFLECGMFVQSQQALPVLQEWVLLWTPGSQLIAARLCRGSPLLFPGEDTVFCNFQILAPPASLAGFSTAGGRRMPGDLGVISLLWSLFLLSDQKASQGNMPGCPRECAVLVWE